TMSQETMSMPASIGFSFLHHWCHHSIIASQCCRARATGASAQQVTCAQRHRDARGVLCQSEVSLRIPVPLSAACWWGGYRTAEGGVAAEGTDGRRACTREPRRAHHAGPQRGGRRRLT